MDLILFDKDFQEIGPAKLEVDFEIGDSSTSNDFEITTAMTDFYGFYIPGTEVGGIVECQVSISNSATKTLKGWSWRGLLSQWIISPPSGSDYKIVSGEANTVIRELMNDCLDGFFTVLEEDSGLTISNYQFKLYTSMLEGVMDMLSENDYRLDIYAKKTDPGGKVKLFCRALPITKLEGEYNNDVGLTLTFTDNRMGINHLICMGKGELQERQRVDFYIGPSGKVTRTQYYKGLAERQAYYNYSSAESYLELQKSGAEKLRELASSKKLRIDAESVDLNVGDVVVGRYRETGLVVEAPINKKIYRISNGRMTIEYGVKEET